MDRHEAARLLGVAPGASAAEVQAAFRRRARSAHPDAGGSAGDLDRLAAARDLLVSPAPPNGGPETTAPPPPGHPVQRPPGHPVQRPPGHAPPPPAGHAVAPTARPATGGCRDGVGFLMVTVLLMIVLAAGLFIVAVAWSRASTTDDTDLPAPAASECVLIDGSQVTETDCHAPGALRIVTRDSGARTCPAGQHTLIAGATTWCLQAVSG